MRRGHAAIYVTAARQIHRGCTAEVRQRRAHPPRYDSLLIPPPCQCEYSLSIVSSYLVLFHAASPAWTTQPAPPGGCAADSHANCMQQQQQQNRAPPPTTAAAYTATDLPFWAVERAKPGDLEGVGAPPPVALARPLAHESDAGTWGDNSHSAKGPGGDISSQGGPGRVFSAF